MPPERFVEALGLLEIDGVPRAIRCQDEALKRAPVEVLAFAPVSPGKVVFILAGDVASVEESLAAADQIAGSLRIDHLFLPGVHPAVIGALLGKQTPTGTDRSLGVLEFKTVASALRGADCALKAAEISLGRLHLASGFGGKAYFSVFGELCDVEAATTAVLAQEEKNMLDFEVIAAPHPEMSPTLFRRPWALDPS